MPHHAGADRPQRAYAVLAATAPLRQALACSGQASRNQSVADIVRRGVDGELLDISTLETPSSEWGLEVVGECAPVADCAEVVVACEFPDTASQQSFHRCACPRAEAPPGGAELAFLGSGANPGGGQADHWSPGQADLATFGDRADARRLIGADFLRDNRLTGKNVNVLIVDQGLHRDGIPARNWGGGIRYKGRAPGTADPGSHGMQVARNVLDLAPDAVLYDVPLIPPAISQVPLFASDADAICRALRSVVARLREYPCWSGPWVLSNAWAIFDRASEHPLGDYTENLNPSGHPLNHAVAGLVDSGIDVVFAAGNCGEFNPSRRCGPTDRGPGRSIWGANAHPAVITAGAVRADGGWLGYSSQGPGPALLDARKPDLCAPSSFTEALDAHVRNTGTSAAAALVVGVIAALRSHPAWHSGAMPPARLKQALVGTARRAGGEPWEARLGGGVLDVPAAFEALRTMQAQAPAG